MSEGHVYWVHDADRKLECSLDTEHSQQRQAGRRVRFEAWLTDCEQVSVRASGKARIAGKVYRLKRKRAVVGPALTGSEPVSVAIKPRRKQRRKILARLKDGEAAYARIRLEIADTSDNSRVNHFRVRLVRR